MNTSTAVPILLNTPPPAPDIGAPPAVPSRSPYTTEESARAIAQHLSAIFESDDWICLTYIHATKKTEFGAAVTENSLGLVTQITSSAGIAEIQRRNADGWNVYVAMNPLVHGSDRRTKASAAPTPRTVFMEVDEHGDEVLAMVRAAATSGEVPPPSIILKSSPGKYQFIWRIDASDFSPEKVELLNNALVTRFGADPASTDRLRVLRIPSLRNLKYPQQPVVEIVDLHGGPRYVLADFKLAIGEIKDPFNKPVAPDVQLSGIADYFEQAASEANLRFSEIKKWGTFGYLWEITCPWVHEHTGQLDSGSVVMLHNSGALDFRCQHAHCKDRNWPNDFRPRLEKIVGHFLRFGDAVGGLIMGTAKAAPATSATPLAKSNPLSQPAPSEPPQQFNRTRGPAIERDMELTCASQYVPEITPWLWSNRIVANNVNVFSGEPDQGKSLCWTDLVARLTTGRDFPDCDNELGGPVGVVVMASEDDIGSTIIPRLIAAEADLNRVHFAVINESVGGTISEGVAALDKDLPVLETLMDQLKQSGISIALIVVDPIIAFIGDADPNKDKEVRPIFTRMKAFSKKNNVAWLTVNHLNKNTNATSINRTSGAKSFVSAPRASWMFATDPDDPQRRLMMKGKGNLVKQGLKTLAYRIVETTITIDGKPFLDAKQRPVGVPRIQWDGVSEHLADDVLQSAADPTSRRSAKAEELIKEMLDASPTGVVAAADVYRAGERESPALSSDALRRAKGKLGVCVFRTVDCWYWAKSKAEELAFRASGGATTAPQKPEQATIFPNLEETKQ